MGLLDVLTIVFVVLKLVHVISWSWWLVFLPTIIDLTLAVLIWILFGLAAVFLGRR